MTTTGTTQREFTLTWKLDAAPAAVFRAWTDPDHLDWFYNPDHPIPSEPIELDLRVGGAWRQYMVIDEDTAYFTGGIYREIVADEKLVFVWGAADGWPTLDLDELDSSPLVTVSFEGSERGTELTIHVELPATLTDDGLPGWWAYAENGWRDTVDRLAAALVRG
jgi:uncharacterized protein YndB with AHSA1/START domain